MIRSQLWTQKQNIYIYIYINQNSEIIKAMKDMKDMLGKEKNFEGHNMGAKKELS